MSRSLAAQDRSALIRLASSLPKGSGELGGARVGENVAELTTGQNNPKISVLSRILAGSNITALMFRKEEI